MGTHYSNVQDPRILSVRASTWAHSLLQRLKRRRLFPVLVYSGMSGIGGATALSLEFNRIDPEFKFGMMYVRKDGESSHGSFVEIQTDLNREAKNYCYIFVDDFVCTGATFAWCMTRIFMNYEAHKLDRFNAKKVVLVEMNNSIAETRDKMNDTYFIKKLNKAFRRGLEWHGMNMNTRGSFGSFVED